MIFWSSARALLQMARAPDSAEFWLFLLVFAYLEPWGRFDGISWFVCFTRNHMSYQNMQHMSLRAAKIHILMLRHIMMDISLLEMNQFFVILNEFWWWNMKKYSMENFKMDQNSNILIFMHCGMIYWLETDKVIMKWYSGAPRAHFCKWRAPQTLLNFGYFC